MSWYLASETVYRKTYQSWVTPDGEMPLGVQGVIVNRLSAIGDYKFHVRVYKDRKIVCGNVETSMERAIEFFIGKKQLLEKETKNG